MGDFWNWDDRPTTERIGDGGFSDVMTAAVAGEAPDPYTYVLETVRERIRKGGMLSAAQLEQAGEEEERLVRDLALEVAQQYATTAPDSGCNGSAGDAEFGERTQAEYQDRIKDDIDRIRQPQHTHRNRCVAGAAKNTIEQEYK